MTYREERRPLMLPADVRGLPRDEELIFVSGMKPLKAKKICFDHEPIFAQRLRPAPARAPAIPHVHDWQNVCALGRLAPEKKSVSAAGAARNARPTARPPAAPPAQTDLFAVTAPSSPQAESSFPPAKSSPPSPPGPKISELALAGLRPAQSPPVASFLETPPLSPPGPTPEPEPGGAPARRRARATGV